jgi:hypothetical protein
VTNEQRKLVAQVVAEFRDLQLKGIEQTRAAVRFIDHQDERRLEEFLSSCSAVHAQIHRLHESVLALRSCSPPPLELVS